MDEWSVGHPLKLLKFLHNNLGHTYKTKCLLISDQSVLRDIYLSEDIDDVVKQEVCTESEFSHLTKWVYFATETGVMRFFPDRVWTRNCRETETMYDSAQLYDGRTAPWYINVSL